MGFISIGNFNLLSWGRGNDRYTRTPSGFRYDPAFEMNKKSAQWEVIKGHERHLFETTGRLNAVINRHASMFANGRFVHKRKNGTKEGEVIEDSPLVELLENPNPLQSGEEWLHEAAVNYWIFGNNLIMPMYPAGIKSGQIPYVINNLPWDQVKIETTGMRWNKRKIDDIIKSYKITYNDSPDDTYKASEVIHFRRSGGKSAIVGESVLNSLHMEISNIRGAMGYRNVNINQKGALGYMYNKSRDSISGRPLSDEDRRAIEMQEQNETYGQFEGQSKVKVIDGDLGFIHTSLGIRENMLFEEIDSDTRAIIDALNLNDNIFSREKASTFANLKEGLVMAYQDGVMPFAGRFCSALKRGLGLPDNEWIELDYSHLPCFQRDEKLAADVEAKKAKAYKDYTSAGMSDADARAILGIK